MMKQSIFLAIAAALSFVAGKPGKGLPAHEGKPIGKEVKNNENITLYVTGKESDTAVLYLTDVFGIQLSENKLLADSFGRAGFLTIAPDLFNGTPAPEDINGTPGFNASDFLYRHRPEIIDPVIASVISYIHSIPAVKRIVATGYCFGGRHVFRVLSQGKGVDAGFTAHPSLLEDDEIKAIIGPASIAAAETDDMLTPARRAEIEALLKETGQAYSVALYSGTNHGFAVRANISDPEQKFGKEQAFWQAVTWFKAWA